MWKGAIVFQRKGSLMENGKQLLETVKIKTLITNDVVCIYEKRDQNKDQIQLSKVVNLVRNSRERYSSRQR